MPVDLIFLAATLQIEILVDQKFGEFGKIAKILITRLSVGVSCLELIR